MDIFIEYNKLKTFPNSNLVEIKNSDRFHSQTRDNAHKILEKRGYFEYVDKLSNLGTLMASDLVK